MKTVRKKKGYSARDLAEVRDNPRWSESEMRAAKPFAEVFPDLARSLKRGRPSKEVKKISVTIRLDPDVVEVFKAHGNGWQTRMNAELRRAANRLRKVGR
jgi:uncharacterized protein (DUF4415 family)